MQLNPSRAAAGKSETEVLLGGLEKLAKLATAAAQKG